MFEDTRATLVERKRRGLDGGMQFTYRNPERSTDPRRILPGARTLVVGAWSYRRLEGDAAEERAGAPAGSVARYARRDHYDSLRQALSVVARRLSDLGWRATVVCDDNALVDRAAAHRAGIGWFGKNSLLMVDGLGSWFVLGTVVTDAPLPPAQPEERRAHGSGCGACTRCLRACPTGALIAPGVVDARRCLAWLVQAEGPFPVEYRRALGDRVYGCDACQEVCPINHQADRREPPPPAERDSRSRVDLLALLASSDDELLRAHTALVRPAARPPIPADATRSSRSATSGTGTTRRLAMRSGTGQRSTTRCLPSTHAGPPHVSAAQSQNRPGDPPPRHQRLPAESRRHPVVPLGALAAARPGLLRRAHRTLRSRRGRLRPGAGGPRDSHRSGPEPGARPDPPAGGSHPCRGRSGRGGSGRLRPRVSARGARPPDRRPVLRRPPRRRGRRSRTGAGRQATGRAPAPPQRPRDIRRLLPRGRGSAGAAGTWDAPGRRDPPGGRPRPVLAAHPLGETRRAGKTRAVDGGSPRREREPSGAAQGNGRPDRRRGPTPAGVARPPRCDRRAWPRRRPPGRQDRRAPRAGSPPRRARRHRDRRPGRRRRRVRHALPQPLARSRAGGLRDRVRRGCGCRGSPGGRRLGRRGRGGRRRGDRHRAPAPDSGRRRCTCNFAAWCETTSCAPACRWPRAARAEGSFDYDVLAPRLAAALSGVGG